jgi:hypothetical protein
LPDVIDGDEDDNDRLLRRYQHVTGVPVWHLHESYGRLQRLIGQFGRVCFGSSSLLSTINSEAWRRRVTEAFDLVADPAGRVPWIHMLRGMSLSGGEFPFASVDSTDVARNHNRAYNDAVRMVRRWDAKQSPGRWVTHRQLQMETLA